MGVCFFFTCKYAEAVVARSIILTRGFIETVSARHFISIRAIKVPFDISLFFRIPSAFKTTSLNRGSKFLCSHIHTIATIDCPFYRLLTEIDFCCKRTCRPI